MVMTMTIKEARLAAGMTQQRMSDVLGIPKRTIESWEQGKRKCPEWEERLVVDKLKQIRDTGAVTWDGLE